MSSPSGSKGPTGSEAATVEGAASTDSKTGGAAIPGIGMHSAQQRAESRQGPQL